MIVILLKDEVFSSPTGKSNEINEMNRKEKSVNDSPY